MWSGFLDSRQPKTLTCPRALGCKGVEGVESCGKLWKALGRIGDVEDSQIPNSERVLHVQELWDAKEWKEWKAVEGCGRLWKLSNARRLWEAVEDLGSCPRLQNAEGCGSSGPVEGMCL